MMDDELFELAIEAAAVVEREKGIGTLSEGVLHSAVKYYYQPDPALHEIKIDGFVCDAVSETYGLGRTVIEVQTANFGNLKKKLSRFLGKNALDGAKEKYAEENAVKSLSVSSGAVNTQKTLLEEIGTGKEMEFPGNVTVIYPMASAKRIIWVDPDTGEATVGGRSTKGFIPASCLWELYRLKEYVGKEGFTFIILGMSIEERKLLCGWSRDRKRGSRRIERVPLKLTHEMVFRQLSDYGRLVPDTLGDRFDAKEFGKAAKMTDVTGNAALRCLTAMGVLKREFVGRKYIYSRVFWKNKGE